MNDAAPSTRHRRSPTERDLDAYLEALRRFERVRSSAEAWRQLRLLHRTYGQRQDGVHMQRVKISQGLLSAAQLEALADVAERHSRGLAT